MKVNWSIKHTYSLVGSVLLIGSMLFFYQKSQDPEPDQHSNLTDGSTIQTSDRNKNNPASLTAIVVDPPTEIVATDPPEIKELRMLSPVEGYIAESPSVDFGWEDLSNPTAVYDLHIYSDAARTQIVTGTNGAVFDASDLGPATSHTLTDDPSDGAARFGLLIQWPDSSYDPNAKQELLFEYTAYTSENPKPDSDPETAKPNAVPANVQPASANVKPDAAPATAKPNAAVPNAQPSPAPATAKPSAASPITKPSSASSDAKVKVLQTEFDKLDTSEFGFTLDDRRIDGRMTAPSGYQAWAYLSSLAIMHEHFPDRDYLEPGIDFALKFIASGKDMAGTSQQGYTHVLDGYPDWYAANGTGQYQKVPAQNHYDFRAGAGIGNLLYAILETGYQPKQSNAAEILHQHLLTIWDKWSIGPLSKISNLKNIDQGEALARLSQMAMALDYADSNTGNNQWSAFVNSGYWRDYVKVVQTKFDANPRGPYPTHVDKIHTLDDTSHTMDHMFAYTRAIRRGYTLEGNLNSRFIDSLVTFTNTVIWPTSRKHFAYNIDGTGDAAIFIGGWAALSANDPVLRQRFTDYYFDPSNNMPQTTWFEFRSLYIASLIDAELNGKL